MRVLVCGGRNFSSRTALYNVLYMIKPSLVIHGGAPGADTLAGKWARDNNIPVLVFPADWDKYGKAAGFIRNQKMLGEGRPDMVVAFPGGRGTEDMIRRSLAAGFCVLSVLLPAPEADAVDSSKDEHDEPPVPLRGDF